MNEEALNTMYELAKKEGYGKSIDDFVVLLQTNEDALNTIYSIAKKEGYKKPISEFTTLMGVKKETAPTRKENKKSLISSKLNEITQQYAQLEDSIKKGRISEWKGKNMRAELDQSKRVLERRLKRINK